MTALRPLGRTGTSIAPLVLGAMNFGDPTPRAESIAVIDRAIDAGITLIDTADVYVDGESERIVGAALAANGRRDQVLIATKVGMPRGDGPVDTWHRREHIVASCEQSLRWIGASTFPAWMVMEALAIAERSGLSSFVSEQPPYNLLDRRIDNELVPLCQRHGLAILPWSPLGGGILAGRYGSAVDVPADSRASRRAQVRNRITPAAVEVAQRMGAIAPELGLTTSQLALLWAKDQPGVTAPIVGPRTMAQLDDALGVLDRSLDADTADACDELVHPGNAVSDFFNTAHWMRARVS